MDRWVPVTPYTMQVLRRAAEAQGKARNLIEPELSLKQWFSRLRHIWSSVRNDYGLKKLPRPASSLCVCPVSRADWLCGTRCCGPADRGSRIRTAKPG